MRPLCGLLALLCGCEALEFRPHARWGICAEARDLEQRGDAGALDAYATCVNDGGFTDSHLGYQRMLIDAEGKDAAIARYETLRSSQSSPTVRWAAARLQPPDARRLRLEALRKEVPWHIPTYYELSLLYSERELGRQSRSDQVKEKLYLGEFLARTEELPFTHGFVDDTVRTNWVDDAKRRMEQLADVDAPTAFPPVTLTAIHSNAGWLIGLTLHDPALRVQWRPRGDEAWSTGSGFHRPLGTPTTVFEVRFLDSYYAWKGPFEVEFDPGDLATIIAQDELRSAGASGWIAIEAPTGTPSLYVSSIVSARCGVQTLEYGIDVEEPDRVWDLPACDPADPVAIRGSMKLFEHLPDGSRFVTARLTFADGDVSDIVRVDVER